MAKMVYIKTIEPNTFLHFSRKGESFCLRDYSQSPIRPPIEVMRQNCGITASEIENEARKPGNKILAAAAVPLGDTRFWHQRTLELNVEYLGAKSSTPADVRTPTTPEEIQTPASEVASGTPADAVSELLSMLRTEGYSPDDDPWLPEAKPLVEQSIDRLVEEFLEYSYLHRVEHSIHAELFHIMMSHQQLAQRVPLGDGIAITQLVHKEWPETTPRDGRGGRGNFDLAVLSPKLLGSCPSLDAFQKGYLVAPIVIEIGLNYDARHLASDAQKLLNSKPRYGYLVHLARDCAREPQAEEIILEIERRAERIKTAYAWSAGDRRAFKLLNDTAITER